MKTNLLQTSVVFADYGSTIIHQNFSIMIITKETKERFVKMLDARQIIVICEMNKRKDCCRNNCYKFVGVDGGRWDFTPMVAQISGHDTRNENDAQLVSVKSIDGASVIVDTLIALSEEGIIEPIISRDCEYFKVRDLLTTFYI